MKICLIVQNLFTLGGVQRTVVSIVNHLGTNSNYNFCVLMPSNYDSTKCFTINSNRVELIELEKIYNDKKTIICKILYKINIYLGVFDNEFLSEIAKLTLFNKKKLLKLVNWINEKKFDAVIGVSANYSLLLSIISEKLNTTCIGWMHSTYDGYFHRRGQNLFGLETLFIKNANKLDSMLVLNNIDKTKFSSKCNIDCHIMHNPITLDKAQKDKKKEYDLIYVGRLNKTVKGLDYLIKVINKVVNNKKNIKCVIVGEGYDCKYLLNEIRKRQLSNNIELVGFSDDVNKYYQKSKLLISTSRWEGFGLTIVEAMQFGVPTIAFDNEGPSEIIKNSKNGYLIPKYDVNLFAETIISCLDNEKKYEELSEKAIESSKEYSIELITNRFINLIERIVNEKKENNNYC